MTSINSISNGSAVPVTGSSTATSGVKTTENSFLKLLVTQMQNQDPLNPMDNAQVTSQIAQLDTVQGIDTLNATLTSLASSFSSAQSVQATNLIGHSVLAPGSNLTLQGGAAAFGVSLPQSVDTLKVSIKDASGKVVDTMDVGPNASGTVLLGWNGATNSGTTAADGAYTFSVSAASAGVAVSATPLGVNQVTGVTPSASGAMLNLGGSQTAALSDVKQIM